MSLVADEQVQSHRKRSLLWILSFTTPPLPFSTLVKFLNLCEGLTSGFTGTVKYEGRHYFNGQTGLETVLQYKRLDRPLLLKNNKIKRKGTNNHSDC